MTASAYPVDWAEAKQALRAEVYRLTAMLRSIGGTDVPAVGDWDVGDVAMHISQGWIAIPGLARRDLSGVYEVLPERDRTAGESLITDVWDLSSLLGDLLDADPERDLRVLADRIEERAAAFFRHCAGRSGDERQPWVVEGTTVTLCTLTCHLLNEAVVHGGDIARAAGLGWPVEPDHAIMVIQGWFLPVLAALPPRAMVDQDRAAGVRATYDVRLRGGGHVYLVFDEGAVTLEEPGGRRVDCHVLADPVAMLNVMWGRQSQWKAIAKGQLLAWGRKPWLGPKLRVMMRNP